jgi:hypothetical protein
MLRSGRRVKKIREFDVVPIEEVLSKAVPIDEAEPAESPRVQSLEQRNQKSPSEQKKAGSL